MTKRFLVTGLIFIAMVLLVVGSAAASNIEVDYDDGTSTNTEASKESGPTIHFDVYHHGAKVVGATATDGDRTETWTGQHGSEHADQSEYDNAHWHWIWNPNLLTISGAGGWNDESDNGDNGNGNGDESNGTNGNGTNGNGTNGNGGNGPTFGTPTFDAPTIDEIKQRLAEYRESRAAEPRALPATGGGIALLLLGASLVITGSVLFSKK